MNWAIYLVGSGLLFCNEFGRIQRRLAARFRVPLIPKRVLIGVLTGHEATIDSIHLTQVGHDRMVTAVWSLVRTATRE